MRPLLSVNPETGGWVGSPLERRMRELQAWAREPADGARIECDLGGLAGLAAITLHDQLAFEELANATPLDVLEQMGRQSMAEDDPQ